MMSNNIIYLAGNSFSWHHLLRRSVQGSVLYSATHPKPLPGGDAMHSPCLLKSHLVNKRVFNSGIKSKQGLHPLPGGASDFMNKEMTKGGGSTYNMIIIMKPGK